MNTKLKLWDEKKDWEEAEKLWEEKARLAEAKHPLKVLKTLPQMPGITPETAKHLKWKGLKWIIAKDHKRAILKGILTHPFKYGYRYLKSCFQTKPYRRKGDFFLYGIDSLEHFEEHLKMPNTLFVMGFSYCHKPFECPSGRFTADCIHDANNPVCQQCFIGKCVHACPKNTIPLFIPTIHYIGEKIFEIVHANPNKKVVFLITACEMTLEMFGDFGNMVGIKGLGIRLDGRICNTMQAFKLSEEGTKPGLTVVLEDTKKEILRILKEKRLAMDPK
ncbi:hypothetical protein PHSC3_001965 [Chlamydiales bacterium STE3]|nr:hypothetical protein PHSC3_001965 [Chlamydiales bacterium STE3]